MNSRDRVLQLINLHLSQAKKKNPSFSLRALAKKLEMSPSYLNLILNGKRRLTRMTANKILSVINIDNVDKGLLLSDIELGNNKKSIEYEIKRSREDYNEVDIASLHFDFRLFVSLRALIGTKDFKENYSWISKRLNINEGEIEAGINYLLKHGFVTRNSLGNLRVMDKSFYAGAKGGEESYKLATEAVIDNLEYVQDILEESIENKSIRPAKGKFFYIALPKSKIEIGLKMIEVFFNDMLSTLDIEKDLEEVYNLSVNFVPVTRKVEDDEEAKNVD